MVRVLSCHHFAAQDVFCPPHPPLAMCASKTHLFLATSHCYLEVHDLTQRGCPQKYRLPTVSPVKSLLYCRADDYIATIEGDDETVLRIYLNWQADLSKHPMRVRVAGNMKSLRYSMEEKDSPQRLQAVEVPLKASPVCIAADDHTGNLAVAFHKTVLIYGLCCKREANTDIIYEDFKCLLELQFSFKVLNVSICEEFILAVSTREYQVVKLNLDEIPVTISKNLSMDLEDLAARLEKQRCFKRKQKAAKKNEPCLPDKEPLLQRIRRNTFGRQDARPPPPPPHVVEDKHFFTLDVDDITSSADSTDNGESNMKQRVWLDSIKRAVEVERERTKSTSLSDEVEILGPISTTDCCQKCWAVSVEYEDHCDCNAGPAGALDRGVSTCVYRRLNFNTRRLHSPHLMPIYTNASSSCEDDGDCLDDDGWGTFTSSHRDRLVALCCYVSTDREGFLYDVLPENVQKLSTYPYTGPVSQVRLEGSLLYALSPNGIEIYTMRCQTRAAAGIWPPDSSVVSSSLMKLEPCVIGLQPFMELQFMATTQTHLALFSMQEDSWSVYVLEKPGIDMLHADIRELAAAYKTTSAAAYAQLVQEAYLLAWSHSCFNPNNSTLRALLSTSCLDLAPLCASGRIGKPEHSIDLYLQSKCSLEELLNTTESFDDDFDQPAIMMYLEWMLNAPKETIKCTKVVGDRIVSMFLKHKPSKLPSVVLGATLVDYSPELTLAALKTVIGRQLPDQWQVMAMVCLHLLLGNQGEAEAIMSSLSKDEILAVCSQHINCIVEDRCRLSPLAQLLRRHKPETFVSLLISFYSNGVMHNNEITDVLQFPGPNGTYNWHLEGYLEGILMNSCTESSEQIASQLSSLYMSQLEAIPQHCSHSPSSQGFHIHTPRALISSKGAFAARVSWLDDLDPFTGPDSVPVMPPSVLEEVRCPSPLSSSPIIRKSTSTNGVSEVRNMCHKCTLHLIKTQSLLCSNKLPLTFYSSFLRDLEDSFASVRGYTSLWLLCQQKLDAKVALDCVIDDHPALLTSFLQESFPVHMLEEWKYATQSVLQLTQQLSPSSMPEMHATYTSTLTDVLLSISRHIPPDQLISLIPREGGEFFSKFVQNSKECDQLRQLRDAIVARSVLLRSP